MCRERTLPGDGALSTHTPPHTAPSPFSCRLGIRGRTVMTTHSLSHSALLAPSCQSCDTPPPPPTLCVRTSERAESRPLARRPQPRPVSGRQTGEARAVLGERGIVGKSCEPFISRFLWNFPGGWGARAPRRRGAGLGVAADNHVRERSRGTPPPPHLFIITDTRGQHSLSPPHVHI